MYYSVELCEFKTESPIKQTLDSGCISYCNNIHATNCNENSRRYRLDTTVAVLLTQAYLTQRYLDVFLL